MKKLSCIARLLTGVALLGTLTLPMSHAQEIAIPAFLNCEEDWTRGYLQVYWKHRIDLDGDRIPDFTLASLEQSGSYGDADFGYYMMDLTTALFAEKHVEMYLAPSLQPCRIFLPEAVIPPGTTIPANPPQDSVWAWRNPRDFPALKGVGFGKTGRVQKYFDPRGGSESWTIGYLQTSHIPLVTNVMFGFRIPAADGWHVGWLRLEYFLDLRPPETAESIRLTDYAVHPQSGKDMIAGEHVGPLLSLGASTNTMILFWSTNATNMVLEQKLKLSDPAWVTVPGITNNQYTVTPTNPSSFYRLKTVP
jgi:hypothetical protein